MSKVNTVLGPVDSSALGYTRIHEHLLWLWPGIESDPLVEFDEESAAKAVTEILLAMKKRGVATVVDATPINLSRRADFLVRMAESSGMNIIAATGFSDIPFLPFYYAQMDVDHLAAIMDDEVTRGIRGTSAKAGVIKVGTSRGAVVDPEEKILRAAARVSRSANVPIITHTVDGTLGIEQIDILESEGTDLSRVVIGHTCSSSDLAYYLNIIERGANAGFDRIGWTEFQSDEVRLVAIAGLIGAGHAERIVLSQDILAFLVSVPGLPMPQEECPPTYLEDEFIPRLQRGGIAPEIIEQVMVDNPRRIFGD
jgi:phosphotriesterase-related protein